MTTQQTIARLAKTSLKTVSRVINNDPLVNAKTRARVEEVIAKVGYEPSQAARMMRSQKSNIIGFLADKVATRSSSIELVRGAQDVAWERGKQMMLFNIEQGNKSQTHANAQLAAFRAEAIIYAAMYHQQVDIEANDIPHVLLNCFEADGRFTTIVPDDYRLGYDLTQEIIRRGYRRPVFLNLAETIIASHLRARGFIDAAREHGLDLATNVHIATDPPEKGGGYRIETILPPLLESDKRPDLVICGQDLMAVPVYFTLNRLGFAVGRDIAVASFDNLQPIASLLQPPLSTMELPYYEMGRAAMLAAIDGNETDRVQLIRGAFVDRNSM
jgi:LacI family transcriptional regulator